MGSRATRSVASLGRCLRRQLHSAREKQLPPVLPLLSPAISSSPTEALIDGEQEYLWHLQTLLTDPEASRFGSAQQVLGKDSFVECRHLRNASSSKDERNIGTVNGGSCTRGIWQWSNETTAEAHVHTDAFGSNSDFFSTYLQWRRFDGSVRLLESQHYPGATAMSGVGMDGLISLAKETCERSPHLLLSSLSLNFHQEPSMIIPLEASSVKRKRKKKMNKHKQRKLRRRDRHRN